MKRKIIFILVTLTFQCVLPFAVRAKLPVKVACVGNSITYGTGISDRLHDSYPAQLQRLLGSNYQVDNFGRPGATLLSKGHRPYVQQPEYIQAQNFCADIVVIHLGINDTDPRNWPNYKDDFVKDYLDLIQSFRKVNPGVRCLVARMTPITHRHPRFISGTKQWHLEIQSAIETVAKLSKTELIDFHEPLYPYPWLFPDAIHPSEEGAGKLAKVVYSAITGDYGGLQIPEIFSDHMILQREQPIDIHGLANAGTKVSVKIGKQHKAAIADHQGKWKIRLEPLKAGENYQLEIRTKTQRKVFKDVAVGEVWLCSGQSNMEFLLNQSQGSKEAIADAACTSIRLYNQKARWRTNNESWAVSAIDSVNHLQYFEQTKWELCSSESASDFSAVAYHFGKMLQDSLQIPVGLICNAIGGSTTESWIDRNSLEVDFPAILNDWINNDFIQSWARERASVNLKKSNSRMNRHPYEPCYLFESGILPMEQFPIRGVIWYQGESNAHNFEAHEKLFKLLVNSWRSYWHNPSMPFYYVQLSSLNRPSWTWFRDSQRRLMDQISECGMAVSSDKGDSLNVHPCDKRPIGERLARWALSETYHFRIIPSGPLVDTVSIKGNEVHVSFKYSEGLHGSDGDIRGFEIAENDGLFYPVQAIVKNNQVILKSDKVNIPRFVRYGWQPYTRANLVNRDLLPASTFRIRI